MRQKGFAPLVLLVIVAIVVIGAGYQFWYTRNYPTICCAIPSLSPSMEPSISFQSPNIAPESISATLPVKILKTGFGIKGESVTYPKTVTISITKQFSNQVSAYGAGGKVIVGPIGWIGDGSVGADGSNGASIHPVGNSVDTGPAITYQEFPACQGCALGEAAKYFPRARNQYSMDFSNNVDIPQGLVVTPISDSLVRYSLPDTKEGLEVKGIAHFDSTDSNFVTFISMETRMPKSQLGLSDAILNVFVTSQNLK